MKKTQMKRFINALSEYQAKYLEKYESLTAYLSKKLPEISGLDDLDSLQKRVKKEQIALEAMYKEMAETYNTLKKAKYTPKGKESFEKFNKGFVGTFQVAPPDCKPLFDQIATKRKQIKAEQNPAELLTKLISRFKANNLDLQAFNDFLMNPAVKSKIRTNPIFAAKVGNLNKQIIIRYAQTIARIDQELFLNIRASELFSPWAFKSSPSIMANTAQYNNLADYVGRLILDANSIEERAIIIERWIWVAHYLFDELKDYSGCHAILSVFSRSEIGRLKKTFASLSPECQDALDKMSNELLVSQALKPIFNAQQAVIPAMPLIQRDVTFLEDGNKTVSDLKSKDEKREEMTRRTGGGRKIMHVFKRLQDDRSTFRLSEEIDAPLNDLLRDRLKTPVAPYDSDDGYERSQLLEPVNNELKPAKPVKFGKVLNSASATNQPNMRQQLLQDSIKALTDSVLNNVSGFLKDRNQEAFEMDENYVIDWEKENLELGKLDREKEALVDTLKGFSNNEKNASLLKRANVLIEKLEALDFKHIKMQHLESKLYARLYKLKVEFACAARFNDKNGDPEQISLIIAELEKISQLSEGCQFSANFLKFLNAFNDEVRVFKDLSNPAKEEELTHTELENPGSRTTRFLRCRYSLLYAPVMKEKSSIDEGPTLQTAILA